MGRLIGSAVAAFALTVAAGNASAEELGAVRREQLRMVPRYIGPRLFHRASIGRAEAPSILLTQLRNYNLHKRDNPLSKDFMWAAALDLRGKQAEGLASYYSSIPPVAAKDGNAELSAKGKSIYTFGIPEANIGSCAACHGPNAEGVRQIPRLGGLGYVYLKERLVQWGEKYHVSAEAPMPQIARRLPLEVIEPLASYLSFVE